MAPSDNCLLQRFRASISAWETSQMLDSIARPACGSAKEGPRRPPLLGAKATQRYLAKAGALCAGVRGVYASNCPHADPLLLERRNQSSCCYFTALRKHVVKCAASMTLA